MRARPETARPVHLSFVRGNSPPSSRHAAASALEQQRHSSCRYELLTRASNMLVVVRVAQASVLALYGVQGVASATSSIVTRNFGRGSVRFESTRAHPSSA
jgi:hypothetical protein